MLLLLSLSCCGSSDEPVAPEPTPTPNPPAVEDVAITFAGNLSEERTVTRAALNDNAGPTSFKLWGFKNDAYNASTAAYTGYQTVIDGYRVAFVGGTVPTGWEYIGQGESGREQMIKYWDYSSKAYRYWAYAPADAAGITVATGGTPVATTMSLTIDGNNADDVPYVSEMWFSTGNAALYPDKLFGNTIQMKFYKPVAHVRFMFRFSESVKHYDRTGLSDIEFAPGNGAPIALKGGLTLTYPITGTAVSSSFSSSVASGAAYPDVIDAFTVDYTDATPHWYTVLPRSGQGSFRLTVKVLGEERTADVPAMMMEWKPGYDYTYIFKVNETGGVVLDLLELAMHDWSTGAPRNHNLYNW